MGFGDNRALDVLVRAGDLREGVQLDADEVADLLEALDQGEREQILDEVETVLAQVTMSQTARRGVVRALDSLAS